MNIRLRLTALAAVFAFLTLTISTMHGQVLAATEGIHVPELPRKCIKPKDRPLVPNNLLTPLTCVEPVVNVSATLGNQAESFVVVNPTNTNNLVAFSNIASGGSIFRAYSTNAGASWTRGTVATGVACCDGQAAWDRFGNLFLVYINNGLNQINVILSTDGGVTFRAPVTAGTGSIDQPSIAVGNGSVWVDWNSSGSMVARGAPVTGLGVWGPFNALQAIPSATGSFGGIAVGPGPNGGKVIVTYQNPYGDQGPSTIYANVDADGLGAGGFGPRVTVSATNVGGFDYIPAQSERSIDAEAGVAWDATGGPFNNRIYLVYTDETVNENNDTDILMRTSTNDGATWSAAVRVNDDTTTRSQFLPYVALDPTTGTVAVGFHDCRNDDGVNGTNNIPNDDAEYYGTFSTDGGVTWAPNTRLSGGFSNATDSGNGIDYGDYVGQSVLAGKLYTVWADNANCDGTNPDGTLHAFDLYTNTLITNTLILQCYANFTTAEGCDALNSLTVGAGNTALGWRSLFLDSTGSFNTGVGGGALVLNNGSSNTAVGAVALLLNTTGSNNTAIGTDTLVFNDSGAANTATGYFALMNNTTGGSNTAIGSEALTANTTGTNNTAIGNLALQSSVTTSDHVCIGGQAGSGLTTADNNIIIGHHSGVHSVFGQESDRCFIDNIHGAPVSAATAMTVMVDSDGRLGTVAMGPSGSSSPKGIRPQAIPEAAKQAMLNRNVQNLQATVTQQQKRIETLTTQLKEQAAQIQEVNAQIEMSKPTVKVIANQP